MIGMIQNRRNRNHLRRRRLVALGTAGLLLGAALHVLVVCASKGPSRNGVALTRVNSETLERAARRRSKQPVAVGAADIPHVRHIASLVKTVMPRTDSEYAWNVAANIVHSARENG